MKATQEKGCFTPPLDVMTKDGQHIAFYVLLSMMFTRMSSDVSSVSMMMLLSSDAMLMAYCDKIVHI